MTKKLNKKKHTEVRGAEGTTLKLELNTSEKDDNLSVTSSKSK